MIYSVRWQLLLSMVAVILITVGMSALLANQAANAEIERAHEQDEAIRDQRLTMLVTRAYLQDQRWEDSQQILEYAAELYGGRVVIANNVRMVNYYFWTRASSLQAIHMARKFAVQNTWFNH